MNLSHRLKKLEAGVQYLQGSAGCVALSPYDAAILIIERATLDETPQFASRVGQIDTLLDNHAKAIRTRPFPPLTPKDAALALERAADRDADKDRAEQYRRDRLAVLLPKA